MCLWKFFSLVVNKGKKEAVRTGRLAKLQLHSRVSANRATVICDFECHLYIYACMHQMATCSIKGSVECE
ncbi:hypothetical protein L596_003618 [Steinernema carpocapsae]|uniref:Uncharacterized protein n=1 Tax=Steinernema carpocapsae TaxID=34508 RepID=A0A4U8UT71_STECR|nr:hypothetical protein L596_003618 [Steinernema carpocapsae]